MNGFNTEEIIRMAQEAGWGFNNSRDSDFVKAQLKFAALVAAAEREACAKVCEQRAADHEEDSRFENDPDYKKRFLVYAKYERRCAKEIRARGNDAA